MLDPIILRKNLDLVAQKLAYRGFILDINNFRKLEQERKQLQIKTETLQREHNYFSKQIGIIKLYNNKDNINIEVLHKKNNNVIHKLNETKYKLKKIKNDINHIACNLPNIPDDSIPKGINDDCNIEISRWGKPNNFDFKIKDHVTLGNILNGLDFSAAAKITGSRFIFMKGLIARLHRALSQFMLDLHIEQHNYIETYVPYLVNYKTLYGTGQLPKFSEDLFHIKQDSKQLSKYEYALIPTAEVSITNLVRDEILQEDELPIRLVAHTPCFRSEAGSYGHDSHGLIRMHQFDKVELVQIVRPEQSMKSLEEITIHAEKVLQLLKLPYRKVLLCTGNISFSSCKSYDLEVWLPSKNKYYEISSCSNTGDFQARRMHTKIRYKNNNKLKFVHTLNGSGLAVGRTLVAIMENYQQADGRIKIPTVLQTYMNGLNYIS